MKVKIIQLPATEPYFGPRPPWISKGKWMVRFVRPMIIEVEGGGFWRLEVPVGYISDRASVPKIAHMVMTPAGDLELASYIHDWLYSHGGETLDVSKKFADRVFKATLKATPTDIPDWKISLAYRGVRFGGRGGWKHGWGENYGRSD